MNGTGTEGKGPETGRGLGKCKKNSPDELQAKLGKGLGKRRKAGEDFRHVGSIRPLK